MRRGGGDVTGPRHQGGSGPVAAAHPTLLPFPLALLAVSAYELCLTRVFICLLQSCRPMQCEEDERAGTEQQR